MSDDDDDELQVELELVSEYEVKYFSVLLDFLVKHSV